MKDEKAKYLIIDAQNVYKQLYEIIEVFICDDSYKVYKPKKIIDARHFFVKNDIPEEFQKIIIKINVSYFLKKETEEYTTGFPFDITAGKIENESNDKFITAFNNRNLYDNQPGNNEIKFRVQLVYKSFQDVMVLLSKIKEKGYLKTYLESMKEFFDLPLDLDLLLQSWDEFPKNSKKALKIYKKNIKNK